MQRKIERVVHDARYVAIIHLETGKDIASHTEWKPSDWEELKRSRSLLVANATKNSKFLYSEYGLVTKYIRVYKETRQTATITETTVSSEFYSEHLAEGK